MNLSSDQKYRDYQLPSPLEVALRKFGTWSDNQLKIEESSFRPTTPLFHYTDRGSLEGILRNQHLWCYAHSDQNDKEEFEYSLTIARKELKRIKDSGGQFGKEFSICAEDLISKYDLTKVFNFFLFSVSQHRDSELLWKRYGHEKTGISIGFTPKLFIADRQTLSPNANDNAHVGLVIYGDSKTIYRHRKIIERAANITEKIGQANKELLRRNSVHSDYINAMTKEYIARQLVWRCITSKRHDRWEIESEARYVIMNQPKNFSDIKTHKDGRRYVMHELPLNGNIAEIMVGSAAPGGEEDWVLNLLKDLCYPTISVTRSLK